MADSKQTAPKRNTAENTGHQRIGRNVAFAWGGYGISIITGFIVPRVLSDHLGQTTLGIWDFSWSVVAYFGFVQLGLGASVNRYVAKHRAVHDADALNRSVSTIAIFQRAVAWLAAVLAIVTAIWLVPLFGAKLGNEISDARWVVVILGLEVSFGIMLTVYGSVIVGCHRWDIHNTISAVTYAAVAAGMVTALFTGYGIVALALIHCVLTTCGELVRWRLSRRVCPELTIDRKYASWAVFKEQAHYSAKSIIPVVSTLVSQQAFSLLLVGFLGPATLAVYSRANNLTRSLQTLAAKLGFILVPAASSMQAVADLDALRRSTLNAITFMSSLGVPAIATFVVFGDTIIRIWMGPQYIVPGLVPLLAVCSLGALIQEPVRSVLAGMNQHGRLALARLVAGIVSVAAVAICLGVFHGHVFAAAIWFCLPQAALDWVYTPWYACRRIGVTGSALWRSALLRPGACSAPYVLGLAVAQVLWSTHLHAAIAAAIIGGVLSASLFYRLILPSRIRDRVARAVVKLTSGRDASKTSKVDHRGPSSDSRPTYLRYWGSHLKSLRQAEALASEFQPLVAAGWSCHLVLERLPSDSKWLEPLQAVNVSFHLETRPPKKLHLRTVARVRRLCRQLRPDIFVCENIHLSPLVGAALARVPTRIWMKHAMNTHFELCRPAGFKERLAVSTRFSAALTTRIIAVSGAIRDELAELGVPREKILVRLNPRRLGAKNQDLTRKDTRAALGFADDDVVVTTVGHAVEVKGWDVLIAAFAAIAASVPRAKLVLVGGTERPHEVPFAARLKHDVAEHNLQSRVTFTGHTHQVSAYLAASDVFVLPSRSEGCAYALIEAMEAGLPCVATKVGSAGDLISSEHNGLLVERNNPVALAAALQKVIANDAFRESLRANSGVPPIVPTATEYAETLAGDYAAFIEHA